MLETPSDLVVYRLQRLSVACCRAVATLSDVSVSAVAMPLRMLELITDAKTFGQNHNVATEIAIHAVENGWHIVPVVCCLSVCLSVCLF